MKPHAPPPLTPAMLTAIAMRLFGPQWKRPLAKALPRNEKSIQRYLKLHEVPEPVQVRLRELVKGAQWDLVELAAVMDGRCPNKCGATNDVDGVPTCNRCGWFWRLQS